MLTADAQFRATANAAFDAWQRQPPYIAFRVDVDVDVSALKGRRRISRAVEARTRDDLAVLQDLPSGQNQLGHSFPLPPTFDAISYFRLDFKLSDPIRQHNPLTTVTMLPPGPGSAVQPIRFAETAPSRPEISAVASTMRNYYATYAADSTDGLAHIVMLPLPALTHNNDSTFFLKDVYIDTANNLPTRVIYSGPTTEFTIDYDTRAPHWVVTHANYRSAIFGPLHIGRTTVTTDAKYSDISYPAAPKDERLR